MDEFAFICAAVRTSYARAGRPGCVIAALSGGADSVLLLRTLHALRDELSFDLRAVHVNHGLRENAALDEAFCRQLCSDMNVPLQVFHVQVSDRGSVEDAARRARYAAFALSASKAENKKRWKKSLPTFWSGWRDLNSRPLEPHSSTLPNCATPRRFRSHQRP